MRAISFLYYLLFFLTPLILSSQTSEIFEFNKFILMLAITSLILAIWLVRMIIEKRLIFKRTFLDFFLIAYLASQFLSYLFSIDKHVSFWGYYSRWNGGLLSNLALAILYWAFVSNMEFKSTLKAIYSLILSAVLVSMWGIPSHFGLDPTCALFSYGWTTNCWTKEFIPTARIFSTLGQPNWLAAFLTAVFPLLWAIEIEKTRETKNTSKNLSLAFLIINSLLFLALLFSGSRSGLLAFLSTLLLFWLLAFYSKSQSKILLKKFANLILLFLLFIIIFGSAFTPSLATLITKTPKPPQPAGVSDSSQIRKIVWKGAVDIWIHYPILGTGPETFASSYYRFRPVEHNLTSEWNFLYNKAHNEFLNYAANTGSVGLVAYIFLIVGSIIQIKPLTRKKDDPTASNFQKGKESSRFFYLQAGILAGYSSILVTNFFGFSVVPVSIIFFLYPAFAFCLKNPKDQTEQTMRKRLSVSQILIIFFILVGATFIIFFYVARIWFADKLYAQAKKFSDQDKNSQALAYIREAIDLFSSEPVYWDELADIASQLANNSLESNDLETASKFAQIATISSNQALAISPQNLEILKSSAVSFNRLSSINANYLNLAKDMLERASTLAPTDAQVTFNLGLSYIRVGENEKAVETIEKSIYLKPNYSDARLTLAMLFENRGDKEKAIEQLKYILEKIDPQNVTAQERLNHLKNKDK